MSLITGAHELCSDSHPVRRPTHAPLQEVRDSQFPPDLLNGLVGGSVLHGGGACDHAQPVRIEPGKLRDHFLGQALAKVVVLLPATEVLKGQYHQHHSTRAGIGSWCWNLNYRTYESVTAFGNRFDEPWLIVAFPQRLAQQRNVRCQAAFFDHGARPDFLQQLFFPDGSALRRDQCNQQVHGFGREHHALCLAKQQPRLRIQTVLAERVLMASSHGGDPVENHKEKSSSRKGLLERRSSYSASQRSNHYDSIQAVSQRGLAFFSTSGRRHAADSRGRGPR